MRLTKHHGLGNDFLVLLDPDASHPLDAAVARALCDRHTGVGADGLIRATPAEPTTEALVRMELRNADGSRAEMSGNGIRCLAQAILLADRAVGATIPIATDAGLRTVTVHEQVDAVTHSVSVAMGVARVEGDAPEWEGGAVARALLVDMGNPHLVLDVSGAGQGALEAVDLVEVGETVNGKVPGGANVHLLTTADEPGAVAIRTYERGVGPTLACGTGACACRGRRPRVGPRRRPGDRRPAGRHSRGHARLRCRRRGGPARPGRLRGRDHPRSVAVALIERAFREKIVLVGVTIPPETVEGTEQSVDELALLVDTAGADEVGRVFQRRQSPDPPTYVGKGKAEELREVALATDCDTVVFDNELTPAQQFNLEKMLGRTAIDRTAVILDIFAQNAHSQEGKAQVELAQLRYRLPRLRRRAGALSQQAGGMSAAGGARIGTRGPGETQLEVDRRRIVRRIHKLEGDLREIDRHRTTQRRAQRRGQLAKVVIVGYTNAGKSTLLNRMTDAGVLVEDRLFATLDATTRRLELPGGEAVLLTDTVGFIRKLPHQLVEAFSSTLDVAVDADLLVHVVDASAPDVGGEHAGRPRRPRRDRRRPRPRAAWRSTRPTWPPTRRHDCEPRTRARWRSAPSPARASSCWWRRSATGSGRSRRWSSWSSPSTAAT